MWLLDRTRNLFDRYRASSTTVRNPRHDDFYLVGFPKSGITWLSTLLANTALIESGRPEIACFTAAHIFIPDVHLSRDVGVPVYDRPPVRMIKSHSAFNINYQFVIYLARDPFDVLKSYYRFTREQGLSFREFSVFCRSKKFGVPAWKGHVRSWFEGNVLGQRYHLLRYEDLLQDSVGELREISRNFGWNLSDDSIQLAVARSGLQEMKNGEELYRSRNPRYTMSFVRGNIADEDFESARAYVYSECREELALLGYTTLDG